MRLYFKFFAIHLKSRMAYKKSFFFSIVGQFLTSFTAFLTIWFLLDRFESVRGYTISECALCFGVILASFSLAECFFRGFDTFSGMVRNAHFDRILLRPRGLIFQVLCQNIEFGRLGKLLQAALMLAYGIAIGGSALDALLSCRAAVSGKFSLLPSNLSGGCAIMETVSDSGVIAHEH